MTVGSDIASAAAARDGGCIMWALGAVFALGLLIGWAVLS